MEATLNAIQIHLWIITGVLVLMLVGNVLCNLSSTRAARLHRKLMNMWEQGKHKELYSLTSSHLRGRPNDSTYLMYHALALVGLDRLEDAREAAVRYKELAPHMRTEAKDMIASIDDMLSSEA